MNRLLKLFLHQREIIVNRFEHEKIKQMIEGYIIPANPQESREAKFERAKANLIMNRKHELEQIEAFLLSDMTRVVS